MDRNGYCGLLLLSGGLLLWALIGPYKGGSGNTSPKYGQSRNDRIPPSYKQSVAICATAFVIEALRVALENLEEENGEHPDP